MDVNLVPGSPGSRLAAVSKSSLLPDIAFALVALAVSLAGAAVTAPDRRSLDVWGVLLLTAASLPLVARRRAPTVVVFLTTGLVLAYQVLGYPDGSAAFPILAAATYAVFMGHAKATVPTVVSAWAVNVTVTFVTLPHGASLREAAQGRFLVAGWLVAALLWAEATRQRLANLRQAQARAADAERRAADAERIREEEARRRAGEERLRIARELHDSLTHSISVIKLQAGVAVHLARKRGDEVPAALLAIQEASADANRELRATLGVLRTPQKADDLLAAPDAPGPDGAPVGSAGGPGNGEDGPDDTAAEARGSGPGYDGGDDDNDEQAGGPGEVLDGAEGSGLLRLRSLIDRITASGLAVELVELGPRRPLPPELDHAAYRIVQEALTNVTRHAHASGAEVRLEFQDGGLAIRVVDDGKGAPGGMPVPGTGLTGMRERVAALGGRLRTGPGPDGGFAVDAQFPAPRSPADPPTAIPAPTAADHRSTSTPTSTAAPVLDPSPEERR